MNTYHRVDPPEQYKVIDPFSEDVYTNLNLISKIFHPTIDGTLSSPLKDLSGVSFNFNSGQDDSLYPTPLSNAIVSLTPGYIILNNIFMYLDSTSFSEFKTRASSTWFNTTDYSEYSYGYVGTNRKYPSFEPVVHLIVRYDPLIDTSGASVGYVFSNADYASISRTPPVDISQKTVCILGSNKMIWHNSPGYGWVRKWQYSRFDHIDLMETGLYPYRQIIPEYVKDRLEIIDKIKYKSEFDLNVPL
jgi:hypothetical protein